MKKLFLLCSFIFLLCFSCKKNSKIEFEKSPLDKYTTSTIYEEALKDIKIKVIVGGKSFSMLGNDSRIKVENFQFEELGSFEATFSYNDLSIKWPYKVSISSWEGSESVNWYKDDEVLHISSNEDFAGFRTLVNNGNSFKGRTIVLDKDLNLNNVQFRPIGSSKIGFSSISDTSFEGHFDGNGHTIYNLSIESKYLDDGGISIENSYYNCGLFGSIKGATIKNLTINNISIINTNMKNGIKQLQGVGSICGYSSGDCTIENVSIKGLIKVRGESRLGGIIGYNNGILKLSNIIIDGTDGSKLYVSNDFIGGLIGVNDGLLTTINDVIVNVEIEGSYSGGLIGKNLSSSMSVLDVSIYKDVVDVKNSFVCGFIGENNDEVKIETCYFLGSIKANSYENCYIVCPNISKVQINNVYYNIGLNSFVSDTKTIGESKEVILSKMKETLKIG